MIIMAGGGRVFFHHMVFHDEDAAGAYVSFPAAATEAGWAEEAQEGATTWLPLLVTVRSSGRGTMTALQYYYYCYYHYYSRTSCLLLLVGRQ